MRAVDLIARKRDGEVLRREEIEWFVQANLRGEVTDYQVSAMLMAIYFRGMSGPEIGYLTRALMESGKILDLSHIAGPKVDKHSTGGVGDKVSLILAPLAACVGLHVPMVAGRGLGFTGGTLDKLETIPGYNVYLPTDKFIETVEKVGCSIIGQTDNICPADRKWYALRDVTATVPSIPLIVASIMSKKLSEGIDALVLDVKVGTGAFMRTMEEAEDLAHSLVRVGREMGKPARAILTDMNQPLGWEIGNASEVAESVAILRNEGEKRLTDLTITLGAHMMAAGGLSDDMDANEATLRKHLADGSALEKFIEMVRAQGGDTRVIEDTSLLPRSPLETEFTAPMPGYLAVVRTAEVGWAAMALGAGRARAEDPIDPGAGITMLKQIGDPVEKGEPICRLRAETEEQLNAGLQRLHRGVLLVETHPPKTTPLIKEVVVKP